MMALTIKNQILLLKKTNVAVYGIPKVKEKGLLTINMIQLKNHIIETVYLLTTMRVIKF